MIITPMPPIIMVMAICILAMVRQGLRWRGCLRRG